MNRKKRILFVTESTTKSTGYSVYSREILKRLHDSGLFYIAELACFCDADEDREAIDNTPWDVIINKPTDPAALEEYSRSGSFEFGEYNFNAALIKTKPDFVMDVRDWWMHEYQQRSRSAFRDYYKWCPMPTVDSSPQHEMWIESYADADAVFTYSEFGKETLENQSDSINIVDIASPAASDDFRPNDKAKKMFGFKSDSIIFGTVMRNQKRKLYPELFSVFKDFISKNKNNNNAYLYCHTYYPDLGWDIPKLLLEYGLTDRVFFTYKCTNCSNVTCNYFHDVNNFCRECNHFKSSLVGTHNPVSDEELSVIYNTFDCYVQYATNEGFGMPQVEAAYCGLPIMTVDYSAMSSVGNNIEAYMIPVLHKAYEAETGLKKAIPDNSEAVKMFREIYNMSDEERKKAGEKSRKLALKYYNWDRAAQKWMNFFLNEPVISESMRETWLSPPEILEPGPPIPDEVKSPKDQARYLFDRVLRKPSWIHGFHWRKLVRDLTYKAHLKSTTNDVFFFNESHIRDNKNNFVEYDKHKAYEQLAHSRNQFNKLEQARWDQINNE
jgi:glycosyltransferase involved in cell wall biosynthesis